MRPSGYAVYWETSVSTRWPCHSMILVSGSNVTSVRNGLPSTWPTIRTDLCLETGNSGLVTLVGSEKVGITRSTRSLSGATGISPGMTGWGIFFDLLSPPAVFDAGELASVAILPELLSFFVVVSDPHAFATHTLANTTIIARPRATDLVRLPPIMPPLQALPFGRSTSELCQPIYTPILRLC